MRRFALLLLFALSVAACGGASDDGEQVSVDTPAAEADETTDPPGTDAASPPDADPDAESLDEDPNDAEEGPTEVPVVPEDGPESPFGDLVLNGTGLDIGDGVLPFGTGAEPVISEVTILLGPPSSDTGSTPTDAGCPTGADTYRTVSWGPLELVFLSQSGFRPEPGEHLVFWFNPTNDAVAEAFVGDSTRVRLVNNVTTVGELRSALGDAIQIADDDLFGPSFIIDDNFGGIRGELSGLGDADVVLSANGGIGCGE